MWWMGWKGFSIQWLWLDGLDGCDWFLMVFVWFVWFAWFVLWWTRDLFGFFGTGRVPHPGSAGKPQPSLHVLVGMQKLLLDQEEIFFKRIRQRPTSLTNNLLECFPNTENIEVGHLPFLPSLQRTTAYGPTSTDFCESFNAWKTWKMADLDIFARYPGQPSSMSSMHWRSQRNSWKLERTPELQDSSLRSRKKNTSKNTSMNVHPPWVPRLHQSQWVWLPTNGSEGDKSCAAWYLCAK